VHLQRVVKQMTVTSDPQLNRCVFNRRQNSSRVSSKSNGWKRKLFRTCSPATVKDWSPRLVWLLGTSHIAMSDD